MAQLLKAVCSALCAKLQQRGLEWRLESKDKRLSQMPLEKKR